MQLVSVRSSLGSRRLPGWEYVSDIAITGDTMGFSCAVSGVNEWSEKYASGTQVEMEIQLTWFNNRNTC